MLEIKLALDVICTPAVGGVSGILVSNLNRCELGVLDGVSLGIY